LNFVQGTGQLDWEILETLWSEFNKVSASAHSMSKAHRAELHDDHMMDSTGRSLWAWVSDSLYLASLGLDSFFHTWLF